ncbi:acyltransferase family protein [Methylobacterium brachiatum]|uniref:acyltransferase family protein n=1 Tax=Methylobacterium brachiatum TaxID=269660 RepID=UPI000EFC7CEA|nr:acyltransferase [Methylobacterium brachiatum]AYO84882.1 acyltransferase [Methylobacterium brachiatum]
MPDSGSQRTGDVPSAMPYLPQLDGVRALAILIVFAAHCGYSHVVPGGFGVTVFFFLSGYLITTLLRIERGRTGTVSLAAFYLRRSLRILPPLYLTLAATGALYAAGLLDWMRVEPVAVLGQVLFLTNYPGLFGTEAVLPVPLWSLAIEEHFYLVFPLAYFLWLGRLQPRRAALACLGICAAVLAIRCVNVWRLPDYSLNYSWTHTRIDAILFGCCLGLWNNPVIPADRAWRPTLWPVAASLAVILLTLAVRDPAFRETLRYTLQSAALFVPFAYLLHGEGWAVRWLSARPMRQLGLWSYSFYLAHMAVVALVLHLAPGLHGLTLMLAAFPLTLLWCWGMYGLVERPCARLRRRLLADRPPEPVLGTVGRSHDLVQSTTRPPLPSGRGLG